MSGDLIGDGLLAFMALCALAVVGISFIALGWAALVLWVGIPLTLAVVVLILGGLVRVIRWLVQ